MMSLEMLVLLKGLDVVRGAVLVQPHEPAVYEMLHFSLEVDLLF